MYLVKTPSWLRWIYPGLVWKIPSKEKVIYLSFDDGPDPMATEFALNTLASYHAKASFFCIGKNVQAHPTLFQKIVAAGHAIGNHTQHHVNGWKTGEAEYIDEILEAEKWIESNLFRPPYGRIKRSVAKKLMDATYMQGRGSSPKKIIMWDILSGDFDLNLTPEACLAYLLYHAQPGSIVVFHDSVKAFPRMQYALPKMLEVFTARGYRFEALPTD